MICYLEALQRSVRVGIGGLLLGGVELGLLAADVPMVSLKNTRKTEGVAR
jgi:hypothetical protein